MIYDTLCLYFTRKVFVYDHGQKFKKFDYQPAIYSYYVYTQNNFLFT